MVDAPRLGGVPELRDWRALVQTGANLLVQGNRTTLDAFCQFIRPMLRGPVAVLACDGPVAFDRAGTLLLLDVDRLAPERQRALYAWTCEARNADCQIIALTSVSLFSLVRAQKFPCDLYYALNTVYLQLAAG